jgi:histone deacetylase HOS2
MTDAMDTSLGLRTLSNDARSEKFLIRDQIHRPKGYTVSYHHNPEVESHHFGQSHPMKPWRLTLTNQLVLGYGMDAGMDVFISRAATKGEMAEFHSDDYLNFLQRVTPENMSEFGDGVKSYNIGDDCPVFDGLWEYCSLYSGPSVDAARKLINDQASIAINWSGGLHHAKKSEASGFCYINDIVLATLQLLRYHPRVMYIDIDVHHGDGVEQAFWSTDRVMTLSFHKYDKEQFFPGTGELGSSGPLNLRNPGSKHSVNVPLNDGIEDADYIALFKDIAGACFQSYRPTAIVLQCGADSLGGDRLGCFNLNIRAHGECVSYIKSLGVPLLVLGGGGYTPRNVARVWAHETSICLGQDVNPALPSDLPLLEHFGPDKTLFPPLSEHRRHDNKNTKKYLSEIVRTVTEQLRYVEASPSVQMTEIPPDILGLREDIDEKLKEERMELDHDTTNELRQVKERGEGTRGEIMA